MLRRYMSLVPLVVTVLQGCQADNSEQIVALQQQVATLNSQIRETGSQLQETDNQLKETRLQVTGLQTANQELDRALKDLVDEISPLTGSDIIPSFESNGKGEIQVASAAKSKEEKKILVTPAVVRSEDEAPVLAAAPAVPTDSVAPVLAAAPAPSLDKKAPVLAATPAAFADGVVPASAVAPATSSDKKPSVLAAAATTAAENPPVLSAAGSIARSGDNGHELPVPAAKLPKTEEPIVVASAIRSDANKIKQAASAAKPRKKVKAIVRLARRSAGFSCGKVWKLFDQGKNESAASEELSATITMVRDCKQEMLRVRKDKDSDQLQTKS